MRRTLLVFSTVAAAYAVGSHLSYTWFGADGLGASFFPAAGVTMAALLMLPRRMWPVVLVAAGTAEFVLDLLHDLGPAAAAGYTLANLAQPLAGAAVLTAVRPRLDLSRMRDLVAFLACAVVAAPVVGAALGATTFVLIDDGSGWVRFFGEWWVGDGLGVLVVGGAILAFRAPPIHGMALRERVAEKAVLAVGAGLATTAVFRLDWFALIYVPLVLLVVSGFRTGTRGAALTGAVIAFVAAQATATGHTFWDSLDVSASLGLLYLQIALAVLISTALAIAAAVGERERAAASRTAAERFREIADVAPAILWMTDRAGGCTYLSRGWYEHTGQDVGDGLGEGWLEAVHEDDREATRATMTRAAARREPFSLDHRLRRRDGRHRWAIMSGQPLRDADGAWVGYVGSVIDVHERTQAERALVESEARFRTLFQAIDEGYGLGEVIVDDAGRAVDYRFLETNPQFEVMTGLRNAVGRTALELVPDLEPQWPERYGRVALEGVATRFELGSRAMGRQFDVFATPVEPRGRFALVFRDVTEQRRAESALRDSELAERRARERAELVNAVTGDLEAVEDVAARAAVLVGSLVPGLADRAVVADAAHGGAVIAAAAVDETSPAGGGRRLGVDLDVGGGVRWTLEVVREDPARQSFDAGDRELLRELADRAGLLLASARLHEREREVASHLQRALLPAELEPHPHIRVAARYVAAEDALEVGGDWYETFLLADGRVGIAAGDVVGHGLAAAATMGRLRTALAALAAHATGPGDLLERLAEFARGPNGTDFATASYAVLDPATGVLEYASAGHPPMLVVGADGTTRWLDEGRSAPLCGIVVDHRPQATTVLEPGSTLIAYTDGLVERRRRPLSDGFGALAEAAAEDPRAPVETMCDRILSRMTSSGNEDDVVLLCLRCEPVSADTYRRHFPARPEELRRLRASVGTWAEGRGVPAPTRRRLLLGTGEACANVVQHAYADPGEGHVEVEITDDGAGDLRVLVRDRGRWRPASTTDAGGYGTGIIVALAEGFSREGGEKGTTVRFAVPRDPAEPG